jgi:hypothetical protein
MEYERKISEVFEFRPGIAGPMDCRVPAEFRDRILVDVIHDGEVIPQEFMRDAGGDPIAFSRFGERYVAERDWGANLVAAHLAGHLGLAGFWTVNVARVLLDFGRFPGSTTGMAGHLDRRAINLPFSEMLAYSQKKRLLEHYYDRISEQYDKNVTGKLIKLAVHTYDPNNKSGVRRPPVSLITRVKGYDADETPGESHFDPLWPHILGEFTAHRVLRNRVALTLEKAGYGCGHNWPYMLPEGSIEVRSQVWNFFQRLHERFNHVHPETAEMPGFKLVWEMLGDTNLRDSESEQLRSYLHRFRRAPRGFQDEFEAARTAYGHVRGFMEADGRAFVDEYRFSPERPSALGIEVRKDLVYEFDSEGNPLAPRPEKARAVAEIIARGVATYLREDRALN